MTEKEAIKRHIDDSRHRVENIQNFMKINKDANIERCEENIYVLEMVIKALEEVQQYRAIGTVEECQEAMEKQRNKNSPDRSWCSSIIRQGAAVLHSISERRDG